MSVCRCVGVLFTRRPKSEKKKPIFNIHIFFSKFLPRVKLGPTHRHTDTPSTCSLSVLRSRLAGCSLPPLAPSQSHVGPSHKTISTLSQSNRPSHIPCRPSHKATDPLTKQQTLSQTMQTLSQTMQTLSQTNRPSHRPHRPSPTLPQATQTLSPLT